MLVISELSAIVWMYKKGTAPAVPGEIRPSAGTIPGTGVNRQDVAHQKGKNMNFRKLAVGSLAAAMMLGMSLTAQAASYDTPIDSVQLDFEYELNTSLTKDLIDVSSNTDGVDKVTISSVTNVTYGKRPTVTIKIKADTGSGYYFDKEDSASLRSESGWSFGGDEVEYKSSKRVSNAQAQVVVRLPKIGGDDKDGLTVESVSWDGDTGRVTWEEAEDGTRYQVKLMRGSSTKETQMTEGTDYNFADAIRKYGIGDYTVRVKAYNGNYSGEWEESEEFEVTEENVNLLGYGSGSSSSGSSSGSGSSSSSSGSGSSTAASGSGAWLKDAGGVWYCNADRSYPRAVWQKIDGYWYYFNEQGYVKTGWFQSPASGLWYYLSPDTDPVGRMMTDTWIGSYYVNADGIWQQ